MDRVIINVLRGSYHCWANTRIDIPNIYTFYNKVRVYVFNIQCDSSMI
jgi:hypothetical protein